MCYSRDDVGIRRQTLYRRVGPNVDAGRSSRFPFPRGERRSPAPEAGDLAALIDLHRRQVYPQPVFVAQLFGHPVAGRLPVFGKSLKGFEPRGMSAVPSGGPVRNCEYAQFRKLANREPSPDAIQSDAQYAVDSTNRWRLFRALEPNRPVRLIARSNISVAIFATAAQPNEARLQSNPTVSSERSKRLYIPCHAGLAAGPIRRLLGSDVARPHVLRCPATPRKVRKTCVAT